jgi:DNA topoisomerase-3
MSDKEIKLYKLIRSAYIAQFLDDYQYESNVIEILCADYKFKAKSNTPLTLGWREVMVDEKEKENDESQDDAKVIPKYTKSDILSVIGQECLSKKTKPLPRFNEGSLITAMKSIAKYINNPSLKSILKETAGIGTEATRANIIETLINREYLVKKGKQLISTEKGRNLISLLPESITNPETTAVWEQQLELIAAGKEELADFFDDQADTLEGMLKQLEKQASISGVPLSTKQHSCPECNSELIRRKGKKGYWWGCTSYPNCKYTCFDSNGLPQPKNKSPNKKGA